jgi:hypothetical protein
MPGADVNLTHIDQYLTDYSIHYENFDFIGKQIFKPKPVDKQSDKYPVWGLERTKLARVDRAPGSASAEAPGIRLSNDLYFCAGKGQKVLLSDETRGNNDGIDFELEITDYLNDVIWLPHEVAVFNALFVGSSVPGTTLSGTSQWSDANNSNPIAAVLAQKTPIEKAILKTPNTLVVSKPVHIQLLQHPVIVDRFKFTMIPSDEEVKQVLRTIFEVDNYLVANAVKDTALQGQATSNDYVWGKNAALLYIAPAMGKRIVTIGTTFMWTYGVPNNAGLLVKRYRDESRTGDWIEYQAWYDLKTVLTGAGYTWTNAVA